MIIADIDYLEHISEMPAVHLNGGRKALAISNFQALAFGNSTYTSSSLNNQTVAYPGYSSASSIVKVIAASSGGVVVASASSSAYASA
ncbi:hypothetical protein [Calothrix sp. NIES-3974]|uniref:hypothetical protein n=1 Tax=Calothrix sp. NIES-3974 TaxID=2005462 RepID=UPI000B5E8B33|nr:hypothetical protein [Calothrix sp. NIES-3974]BAZ05408.1 hypothetical protein NIES3974_20560 [Calothrix sp. NIES-3974]